MLIQQAVAYSCKNKSFSSSLHTQQDYLQGYANAFVASGIMTMLVRWPGYDKDQYIDPEILKNVKGGSYAYLDADGNYYRSGFGLRYE